MKSLLAAALVICFAAQCGKSLAYACTTITTSIHLGTSCTRRPAGKSTRSALRNVMTAALAFRSITAGPTRTTAAWCTGVDRPLMDGARSSLRDYLKPAPPPAGASELSVCLDAFWIQSYAFGSANLHDQSLRVLRRGARANHSSRVGEVVEWLLWTSSGRRVSMQFAQSLWRSLPLSSRWPL
jgi:hypothetical protein